MQRRRPLACEKQVCAKQGFPDPGAALIGLQIDPSDVDSLVKLGVPGGAIGGERIAGRRFDFCYTRTGRPQLGCGDRAGRVQRDGDNVDPCESRGRTQEIVTFRGCCELSSRNVFLLSSSSLVGCTRPFTSVTRDTIVCSPGVASFQA